MTLTRDLLNEIDASWGDYTHDWGDGRNDTTLMTDSSAPQLLSRPAPDVLVPFFVEPPGRHLDINTDVLRSRSPIPEVYRGLECFEEPLIDLDSPTEATPNKSIDLLSSTMINTTPLIPLPESDEALAWELATEVSLLDMNIEDFKNLHPEFQRQI